MRRATSIELVSDVVSASETSISAVRSSVERYAA